MIGTPLKLIHEAAVIDALRLSAAFLTEADIADLTRLESGPPLGLTTSGKGVSAIMSAIFDHDGPVVVALDIKGKLADATSNKHAATGLQMIVLDPFRTSQTSRIKGKKPIGINPMTYIRSHHRSRDAAVLADGIIIPESGDASHFTDRARGCL